MKVEVRITQAFKKRAKPLLKKYPSLIDELENLGRILTENPYYGQALGNDSYKVRLSIKSKGKGKSGGARVITHVDSEVVGAIDVNAEGETTVYLLTIYDKAESESISNKELKELIKNRG